MKTIHLELTEPEAAALVTILSRWPSRPLAAKVGHSRSTLHRWFMRIAWWIGRQVKAETFVQSAQGIEQRKTPDE